MNERNVYYIEFIVCAFFFLSFLITFTISVFDSVSTVDFIQTSPLYSWMNPTAGYVVHVFGNLFFSIVAFCLALHYWKKHNGL